MTVPTGGFGKEIDMPLTNGFSVAHVGTFFWTAPAGITQVLLIGYGGGGGGGGGSSALTNSGAGGGGGQGGISRSVYTSVTPGISYQITVPSVAAGGISDNNGAAGGTLSFTGSDGIQVYFAGGAAGLGGNFAQYPVPGIGGDYHSLHQTLPFLMSLFLMDPQPVAVMVDAQQLLLLEWAVLPIQSKLS